MNYLLGNGVGNMKQGSGFRVQGLGELGSHEMLRKKWDQLSLTIPVAAENADTRVELW